jgi:hypothetical protein
MSAMDNLPGDQRAVLQLVLSRGRSYDAIARLLSINSSAVHDRAVAALRTLGPQTNVDPESQASITDYLLGQLPEDQVPAVRRRLAESPAERAWARVVASELAPLASGPLPEIPTESSGDEAAPDAPESTVPAEPETPAPPSPEPPSPPPAAEPAAAAAAADQPGREPDQSAARPRVSRRGGLMVIGLVAAIIVVVVIVLVASGGGSKHPKTSAAASTSTTTASSSAASASTPSASSSTPTTGTTSSGTSTAAKVVSQINLTPPSGTHNSKAAGIAEVLNEGGTNGIAVVAQHIAPNTTKPPNAYAVWLYNSPGDAHILGFVNPGVTKTGRLSTAGGLPSNASHFKQLIVTLETTASPKTPGTIVLEGTLTGL